MAASADTFSDRAAYESAGSPRASFFRLHRLDLAYAKEMLLPLSLGVIVLMCVLAGNFVYWAINSIVNQGMSVAPVIRLFFLAAPGFAVQGIPAGTILGVCLVLNRAVRDNEILALRGAGTSLQRIVAPFLVVALLASVVDWVIVEKISPRTNDMAEKSLMRLMARSAAPLIESDRYFRAGQYYFYVGDVERQGSNVAVLHNVMVYERDMSNMSTFVPVTFPSVKIAQSAHEEPAGSGTWVLEKVVTHVYNPDGRLLSEAVADRATIHIQESLTTFFSEQKQPFSMTGDELSRQINDLQHAAFDTGRLNSLRVDYYRRYALPAACFVMALVAAPLALRYARHGSFAGLVSAFLLAFLWQGFDGWFRALGIAGYIPALVAAWTTNVLFLSAGALLLWRER